MTKDYANKKNKRSSKKIKSGSSVGSSTKGKVRKQKNNSILLNPMFLTVCIVSGILAASIVYIEYLKYQKYQSYQGKDETKSHSTEYAKKDSEKNKKINSNNIAKHDTPRFEFYHTLPKMEVEVPIVDLSTYKKNNDIKQSKDKYVLQLASFKDKKDAEQMRANLILSGFDVVIQTVKLPSGEVWHRVKTNKVSDLRIAESIHSKLKEKKINSMILVDRS